MKKFYFTIPINEAIKGPVLKPKHLGDLEITGSYFDAENFDFTSVLWKGDLLPLLDNVDDVMATVNVATNQHLAELHLQNLHPSNKYNDFN